MSNFRIEEKNAFRLVGYKTQLSEIDKIYNPQYSEPKTEFFKGLLQNGQMASLRPLAESKYGYAAVTLEDNKTFYYAGVNTKQPLIDGTNEVLFPKGEYLVLTKSGGLSRLSFDQLEEQAFLEILTEDSEFEYCGTPIAEILLNGNPMDCEVEVWIPVKHK